MLRKLMDEIENAKGGIDLDDLSRRLDIDRGTLEGMVQYLVHKGKLRDDNAPTGVSCDKTQGCAGCTAACPFAAKRLPRSYVVVKD